MIGGIAMAFHDQPRFTRDVDILILPADIEKVRDCLETTGYFESSKPWTFKNTKLTLHRFMKTQGEDYVMVDILSGHEKRHRKIVENALAQKSEFGPVRLAQKRDIIWMKKQRGSPQDQVDIGRLKNEKDS